MKIVSLRDEFDESELEDVKKLDADIFVYAYETGSYEGSGFAIWKKDDKYYYHELGHCSCYGPTENLGSSKNMPLTFEQVKEVAEKSYDKYGKDVIKYYETN
jgi:hypothetical protein